MTDVPVDDPETLRRILTNTEALFLDFDGPVCSVFAAFPAHVVANQLRDVLTKGGCHHFPHKIATSSDPFDVLKFAATLGDDESIFIEATFRAHEVEAVSTAKPTPGAHTLIREWNSTGRPLAIVSNNSKAAIETYLRIHKLDDSINYISARTGPDVTQLKPNRRLIDAGLAATGTPAANTIFIGDSIADIQAAHAVKVNIIGYANKSSKVASFRKAHPLAITTSIEYLLQVH